MAAERVRTKTTVAVSTALALLVGCARPTTDQSALKAIRAESQLLLVTWPASKAVTIPKRHWPRAIAKEDPAVVTVSADGVDIMTKPDFDGGYGYFIPRHEGTVPEPAARYSDLGQGVYWYRPY